MVNVAFPFTVDSALHRAGKCRSIGDLIVGLRRTAVPSNSSLAIKLVVSRAITLRSNVHLLASYVDARKTAKSDASSADRP